MPLEDLHANAIVKRDIMAQLVKKILRIEFGSTYFLRMNKKDNTYSYKILHS